VCCPFFCAFLRSETFLWSRLGLLPPCFDLFFPAFGFCSLCLAPNCQIRFHHFVRSCFDLLFTHQIQSVLSSFSICSSRTRSSRSCLHFQFPQALFSVHLPATSAFPVFCLPVFLVTAKFTCVAGSVLLASDFGAAKATTLHSGSSSRRRVSAQSKLWASVQQKPPTSALSAGLCNELWCLLPRSVHSYSNW
jgi:hypothetical protein